MFLAANVGFILASLALDDAVGFVFSMIILTLAGAEISIGLALIILIFRKYSNIYIQSVGKIKN